MTLVAHRSAASRTRSFGALLAIDILTLQCGLWQLGFDPGRFDGLWGPMTQAALHRWYAWWSSRQAVPPGDGPYEHPPYNRGGTVRIPDAWAEVPAAAARGRCAREARGAHQPPPVPEPRPLGPPPIVIAPDGTPAPAPVEPPSVQVESAGMLPWWAWMLGGLALLGGTAYYVRRGEQNDFRMPPPPPSSRGRR